MPNAKRASLAQTTLESERSLLIKSSKNLGLNISDHQYDQLMDYLALFIKWNKAYNLSAIRNPRDMVVLHLLDSLAVAPSLLERTAGFNTARILDVGTGGGLPGIPLAILFPEIQFTLLDSAGKKMRFLFQVATSLGLDNVVVENQRAEAFQPPQTFDLIISRAFASLDDFVACSQHLLSENGVFWAMKGQKPEDELSEISKHYIVSNIQSLDVPGLDAERCLVELQVAL